MIFIFFITSIIIIITIIIVFFAVMVFFILNCIIVIMDRIVVMKGCSWKERFRKELFRKRLRTRIEVDIVFELSATGNIFFCGTVAVVFNGIVAVVVGGGTVAVVVGGGTVAVVVVVGGGTVAVAFNVIVAVVVVSGGGTVTVGGGGNHVSLLFDRRKVWEWRWAWNCHPFERESSIMKHPFVVVDVVRTRILISIVFTNFLA